MGLYPVDLHCARSQPLSEKTFSQGKTGLCRNVGVIVAKLSACPALAKSSFILAKDATCAKW
jgi:hypothetical protein